MGWMGKISSHLWGCEELCRDQVVISMSSGYRRVMINLC